MTIRAAVLREPGDVRVEDVELDPPQAGEVLVRVAAAGVCHSDLHLVNGALGDGRWPMVLGHEGAGVVEALGEDVTDLAVGDPVALCFVPPCGTCPACLAGRRNLCERASGGEPPRDASRRHVAAAVVRRDATPARPDDRLLRRVRGRRCERCGAAPGRPAALAGSAPRVRRHDRLRRRPQRRSRAPGRERRRGRRRRRRAPGDRRREARRRRPDRRGRPRCREARPRGRARRRPRRRHLAGGASRADAAHADRRRRRPCVRGGRSPRDDARRVEVAPAGRDRDRRRARGQGRRRRIAGDRAAPGQGDPRIVLRLRGPVGRDPRAGTTGPGRKSSTSRPSCRTSTRSTVSGRRSTGSAAARARVPSSFWTMPSRARRHRTQGGSRDHDHRRAAQRHATSSPTSRSARRRSSTARMSMRPRARRSTA